MSVTQGRPKGESDARARLILVALSLFSHRHYQTVSTREIAREAGVDAALIRYYFGSKAGLFEQMVRETIAPVVSRFKALSQSEQSSTDIGDIMQLYYRAMGPHPGLPRLIVRVLQEDEGSEAYRIVLSVFEEVITLSRQWLSQSLLTSDALRDGIDADFARLSLVSLMVFPLIAPPVLVRQFGLVPSADNLKRLAEHNVSVIEHGLLNTKRRVD